MILPEKSVLENRRHSEIEINYVVKGRGEFICNGERSLVGEGGRRSEPFLPPQAANYPGLIACARQIFTCAKGEVPHGELLLKSELLRFLWLLETDGSLLRPQKENGPDYGETIRPALEYMTGHYRENISIEDLARLGNRLWLRLRKPLQFQPAVQKDHGLLPHRIPKEKHPQPIHKDGSVK